MERRADRALPPLRAPRRWLRTLPVFLAIVSASTLAIFNYQKSSSSVVSGTLYALRTRRDKPPHGLGGKVSFKGSEAISAHRGFSLRPSNGRWRPKMEEGSSCWNPAGQIHLSTHSLTTTPDLDVSCRWTGKVLVTCTP